MVHGLGLSEGGQTLPQGGKQLPLGPEHGWMQQVQAQNPGGNFRGMRQAAFSHPAILLSHPLCLIHQGPIPPRTPRRSLMEKMCPHLSNPSLCPSQSCLSKPRPRSPTQQYSNLLFSLKNQSLSTPHMAPPHQGPTGDLDSQMRHGTMEDLNEKAMCLVEWIFNTSHTKIIQETC